MGQKYFETLHKINSGCVQCITKIVSTQRTFNTSLIWRNSGTLDANTVLQNGLCRINCHLIIGRITMWKSQIKILRLDIEVWKYQLQTQTLKF